jgi:hypothetical protein
MQVKPKNLITKLNECYIGKPRNNHGNKCKYSSSLWMNDSFHCSNVWMKKLIEFTSFKYIKIPSKLWMSVLLYH